MHSKFCIPGRFCSHSVCRYSLILDTDANTHLIISCGDAYHCHIHLLMWNSSFTGLTHVWTHACTLKNNNNKTKIQKNKKAESWILESRPVYTEAEASYTGGFFFLCTDNSGKRSCAKRRRWSWCWRKGSEGKEGFGQRVPPVGESDPRGIAVPHCTSSLVLLNIHSLKWVMELCRAKPSAVAWLLFDLSQCLTTYRSPTKVGFRSKCRKTNKTVLNCWGVIFFDLEDLKQSKSNWRKKEKKGESPTLFIKSLSPHWLSEIWSW